jgi:hypothetical protein
MSRFAHAQGMLGCVGLGAEVHGWADAHGVDGMATQGQRVVGAAMVEGARVALIHNANWKAQFEYLHSRLGKDEAIVAISRQLIVVVCHASNDREPPQQTAAIAIAFKMMTWAREGRREIRQTPIATHFVLL